MMVDAQTSVATVRLISVCEGMEPAFQVSDLSEFCLFVPGPPVVSSSATVPFAEHNPLQFLIPLTLPFC